MREEEGTPLPAGLQAGRNLFLFSSLSCTLALRVPSLPALKLKPRRRSLGLQPADSPCRSWGLSASLTTEPEPYEKSLLHRGCVHTHPIGSDSLENPKSLLEHPVTHLTPQGPCEWLRSTPDVCSSRTYAAAHCAHCDHLGTEQSRICGERGGPASLPSKVPVS